MKYCWEWTIEAITRSSFVHLVHVICQSRETPCKVKLWSFIRNFPNPVCQLQFHVSNQQRRGTFCSSKYSFHYSISYQVRWRWLHQLWIHFLIFCKEGNLISAAFIWSKYWNIRWIRYYVNLDWLISINSSEIYRFLCCIRIICAL